MSPAFVTSNFSLIKSSKTCSFSGSHHSFVQSHKSSSSSLTNAKHRRQNYRRTRSWKLCIEQPPKADDSNTKPPENGNAAQQNDGNEDLEEKETQGSDSLSTAADEIQQEKITRNRSILGAFYLGLVVYSFFFAPGDVGMNNGILKQILSKDFFEVNMVFLSIFNFMGVIAFNYIIILNSGASRQRKWLPTELFSFTSLFFGFFALGPFLTFRQYAPQVTKDEIMSRGFLSKLLENKIVAFVNVAVCIYWYAHGFGLFLDGPELWHDMVFFSSSVDFFRAFSADKFVNVTTLDFIFTSIFFWSPLTEDMRRRGWFKQGIELESAFTAFIILSTPALGPALYLALRPSLPDKISPPCD